MSTTPIEPDNQPETKRSRKALYAVIGSVAGAAVVAASILGIEAANHQPDKRPVATAPAEPSKTPEAKPTPSEAAEALTVQSAEIPAGLTPEQLGTTFIDRVSAWDMAGATEVNSAEYTKAIAAGTTSDFLKQISEANGNIYAAALFGSDESLWQQPYVDNQKKGNAISMELWFKTSAGVSKLDVAPYKQWDTVDSVTLVTKEGDSTTLHIAVTEHEELRNRALELQNGTDTIDGTKDVWTVNFKTVGNTEQVTSFTIH